LFADIFVKKMDWIHLHQAREGGFKGSKQQNYQRVQTTNSLAVQTW